MTTDGFLVCPEHGDIFWQEGAMSHDIVEPHLVEALHDDAPTPIRGHPLECFCGKNLRREVRGKVVVL